MPMPIGRPHPRTGTAGAMRLARPAAYGVVAVRVAVSGGFAFAPNTAMRNLFGVGANSASARGVAAHYAVRDLALGAGLWRSLRRRRRQRAWMLAGTAADAVDFAAIVATANRKDRRTQTLLMTQMTVIVLSDLLIAAALEEADRSAP